MEYTYHEIKTEYGTFTNNEYTNQTAEEVYQEWLENKDKPIIKLPTQEERLQSLEQMELDRILGGF